MKVFLFELIILVICLACFPISSNPINLAFANRIEGQVFDEHNTPIAEVNVELMNEMNSLLARTTTGASGRFTFNNLSTGRFIIKVMAIGKNLLSETKQIEIAAIRNGAGNVEYVDFYLRLDKRVNQLNSEKPDVVFVQEIPLLAEKMYEAGIKNLEKNKDQGLSELEKAVEIFPTYYIALNRLGKEYIKRKNYEKAYPYLLKAIDINSRSFSSYYQLAFAFYQLKQNAAAIEAVKASLVLDSSSINANLLYGTLLRLNGVFQEAEKILLTANNLGKGKVPDVHLQLALLYNRLNRNQEAVNELEVYLKLVPETPDRKNIETTIAKLKESINKTN